MIKLKIDPEFKAKIPAMTDEQFNGLREDILRDGYVRDPLVVWQEETTLLDGHHRWTIICENWELLKDKYSIDYKSFPDRWAALEWICRNQLNKHNLNDEQITYIRGEMYKARKKSVGAQQGNDNAKKQSPQNEDFVSNRHPSKTADAIAAELGIGRATVERSEKFHDGIDALREVSPEAADKVMKGGSGVKKQDVMSVPKMELEEREQFAADVISGEAKKKSPKHHSQTKKEREALAQTEAIINDMYDVNTVPEYTVEFLVEDILTNGQKYVDLLRNTLKDRYYLLTAENRPVIAETIDEIISKITNIKENVTA